MLILGVCVLIFTNYTLLLLASVVCIFYNITVWPSDQSENINSHHCFFHVNAHL